VLHPENARDLMLAQGDERRSRGETGPPQNTPQRVEIPLNLRWSGLESAVPGRGASRGLLGDVLVSAVEVFTGVATTTAATFAAAEVVKLVDNQVIAGVYELGRGLPPDTLKNSGLLRESLPVLDKGKPLLVLVHGTFSNTVGTFGKLWLEHPELVGNLLDAYGGSVFALDHETLGQSPIGNALDLAKACPEGACLHLLTHSRGGLVAEVMAKVCSDPPASVAGTDKLFAGDAYKRHRAELAQLADIVTRKGIKVERVVRVACPARGTLLASKRLDAYLSVFRWGLELAGVPVAPYLVEFLGEVAQHRANPDEIPGLAAQIPDGPLVQWLHLTERAIEGDLRVVAGDLEGDSVVSWAKTLLADAFYWTDNDLVVQTSSMYGGAPRAADSTFVLDHGGGVSHFKYFSNSLTAKAIVSALVESMPPGFRVIGPMSWKGESSGGVRAAATGTSDGDKPAVFLLPGILGSNLKVGDKRVWLSWRIVNGLDSLKYNPEGDDVSPDGPIDSTYRCLSRFLAQTHEVVEFAYDWRKPIEEEAERLAKAIEEALDARRHNDKPVRILAHSMGGLVARTVQLVKPETWDRMMAVKGARFLMLGTPNGGSWAPMQVLSGDDQIGNLLVTFGLPFHDHEARELMAQFPGFIQMQAGLTNPALGLDDRARWQTLADDDLASVQARNWWHTEPIQLNEYKWGIPGEDVLKSAVDLRIKLDAQAQGVLGRFSDKMALVVGNAPFTPDGFDLEADGLVYLHAQDGGDGRVTLGNARLPGVQTWKLDCEHGSLPSREEAFPAYAELLENGFTEKAPLTSSAEVRGESPAPSSLMPLRPSRAPKSRIPPESEQQATASDSARARPALEVYAGAALGVTVINGDLTFIHQPLMIGHYSALRLTGTEWVMNRLLGGAMERELRKGNYPVAVGAKDVFMNSQLDPDNPWRIPRPEAVVVVGLGEEGKLRHSDLVASVVQGVLAWSKRVADRGPGAPTQFDLAATLIGSGGTGFTAGDSAQLIAQGVREANRRLLQDDAPSVGHLTLVELYLERATEAWRALQVQAVATPSRYRLTEVIHTCDGALVRPLDAGYRGADYDFISAATTTDQHGQSGISYTLDTKRARSEVRDQTTQTALVRQLVVSAATDRNTDLQVGRTLFNLLVPPVMEPFLGGTTEMVLELDPGTAGIPWELLDTDAGVEGENRPWAIRAKLLRKLRTKEFRENVVQANADALMLVIGEPQCDPPYPRLPGARAEANAVAKKLAGADAIDSAMVRTLISPDDERRPGYPARAIVNAIHSQKWRIVHISGHGALPGDGKPGGVVLSDGTILGATEIGNIRPVPELVFVNCCHLGARDPEELLKAGFNPPGFAASVAEALINIGVRCVVAAGWAVDDESASTFATSFYDAVLRGERFIDAVARAREDAYTPRNNTWAAYQCYGDPDWIFERRGRDPKRPSQPPGDEFASVASSRGLQLALETLEVRSNFQNADSRDQQAKIRYLEARFEKVWGHVGSVAEAFGKAWAAADHRANAVKWYESALRAGDGSATIKATEQLSNLRARAAWESVRDHPEDGAAKAAHKEIDLALDALHKLTELQPTVERESLIASAYKRRAMVNAALGKPDTEALHLARKYYHLAEIHARENDPARFYYPALNRVAIEIVLDAARPQPRRLSRAVVQEIQASLDRTRDQPSFWSVAGAIELRLYQALAARKVSDEIARAKLEEEYRDLRTRVSSRLKWASILDQMHFVLPGYALHVPAEEKAARGLLEFLEKLARS